VDAVEAGRLRPKDHILVKKSAWSDCVIRPQEDVPCSITYLNEIGQFHVFPLDVHSLLQPKYISMSEILRRIP
jgi:hypothetical protein